MAKGRRSSMAMYAFVFQIRDRRRGYKSREVWGLQNVCVGSGCISYTGRVSGRLDRLGRFSSFHQHFLSTTTITKKQIDKMASAKAKVEERLDRAVNESKPTKNRSPELVPLLAEWEKVRRNCA